MNSNGGPSGRRFAVLALHGFPATADDWTPLRDELRDFEWMMPDMPWLAGATVTDKLTFADCLMQIQKMIGEHGDLPVHMIGHDIGGVLAWWIAALLPHMVRSLTVISAPHPKAYLGALAQLDAEARRNYVDDLLAGSADAPLNPAAYENAAREEPGTLQYVLNGLSHSSPARTRSLYLSALSDTAVQGATQFPRLAVPVCFFQGDHDRCFPPELDTATRRLVGSNVAGGLIAGAGHFLHLTHAPILAKQIATFWTASEA